MQAIEVAGAIFQQQRRWPFLACVMTLLDEVRKPLGITKLIAESFGPLVGKRRKLRIDRSPEMLHDLGQRIVKIFIFTAAERIARHFNSRAKAAVVGVVAGDLVATLLCEQGGKQREAALIELSARELPDFVFAIGR